MDDFYKYFSNENLINKHHFLSYNDFLENKIKSILNSDFFSIESINKIINIKFTNVKFVKSDYTPNECRLKNLNYYMKVNVTVNLNIKNEDSIIINDFTLCEIPLLVLSKYCNLYDLVDNEDSNSNKHELYKVGECINELGGYFIINGKEKVIVSQERLAL